MELYTGDVVWVSFSEGLGREQGGRRPAVIVSSRLYLDVIDSLALVVPVTTRDRDWPNHVRLTGDSGLALPSWAMTEQPSTISRHRVVRFSGRVDTQCLEKIRVYLSDFLAL